MLAIASEEAIMFATAGIISFGCFSCCRSRSEKLLQTSRLSQRCTAEKAALLQKSGATTLRLAKLKGAWQYFIPDIRMLEENDTLSFCNWECFYIVLIFISLPLAFLFSLSVTTES